MRNCKQEFLKEVKDRVVLCADVCKGDDNWYAKDRRAAELPVGYSAEDYAHFLALLDYEYDDGYGGQEVFGTIWYTDGTWSERGEYDGAEWWVYRKVPPIPTSLTNKE